MLSLAPAGEPPLAAALSDAADALETCRLHGDEVVTSHVLADALGELLRRARRTPPHALPELARQILYALGQEPGPAIDDDALLPGESIPPVLVRLLADINMPGAGR